MSRCAQRREQRRRIGELMPRHAGPQVREDFTAGTHADVGPDQPGFQLLQQCGVDLPSLQQAAKLAGE